MFFRIFLCFLLFIFIIIVNSHSGNIVGLFCSNKDFQQNLRKMLSQEVNITDNLSNADVIICGGFRKIKTCEKFKKKIIAVNIFRYQIQKINYNKIIAYFPVDFSIDTINQILSKKIKAKNRCVLTHYFQNVKDKNIKIFHVDTIGEVPFILNKALKECDLIISIPDDIVFNYFSIRFIFKKVILNGKMITGFTKEMLKLGAIYSFEINEKKYIKNIVNFVKRYFLEKKKLLKFQVIYPKINELVIYENKNLVK